MIKIKTKTKQDTRLFTRIKKRIQAYTVKAGYIDSPKHWDANFSVAHLAYILDTTTPWGSVRGEGFMFDESKKAKLSTIVNKELSRYFSYSKFKTTAKIVGDVLANEIKFNIKEMSNPANSPYWIEQKGFNDPLRFGSVYGVGPNLLSEVTYKVEFKG